MLAAQIYPGSNLAAVASVGLAQGRAPAVYVALCISSGMLVWSRATVLGIDLLIETFPSTLMLMKTVGGPYLLYLDLKSERASLRGDTSTAFSASNATLFRQDAWRRGVLVVLTNLKAAMMWATFATLLFGHGLSAPHVLAFGH